MQKRVKILTTQACKKIRHIDTLFLWHGRHWSQSSLTTSPTRQSAEPESLNCRVWVHHLWLGITHACPVELVIPRFILRAVRVGLSAHGFQALITMVQGFVMLLLVLSKGCRGLGAENASSVWLELSLYTSYIRADG